MQAGWKDLRPGMNFLLYARARARARVCDEWAFVVEIDVQQCNEKLKSLVKGYAVKVIFNVNEMGLFSNILITEAHTHTNTMRWRTKVRSE